MGSCSQSLAQWLVAPVVEWKQSQNSGMIKRLKVKTPDLNHSSALNYSFSFCLFAARLMLVFCRPEKEERTTWVWVGGAWVNQGDAFKGVWSIRKNEWAWKEDSVCRDWEGNFPD